MLAESDIEMTVASNVTEKSSCGGILLICFIQYINKLNYLNTIGLYIYIHFLHEIYFHPAIEAEICWCMVSGFYEKTLVIRSFSQTKASYIINLTSVVFTLKHYFLFRSDVLILETYHATISTHSKKDQGQSFKLSCS